VSSKLLESITLAELGQPFNKTDFPPVGANYSGVFFGGVKVLSHPVHIVNGGPGPGWEVAFPVGCMVSWSAAAISQVRCFTAS